MVDEAYLALNATAKTVSVYNDGVRGKLRIKGDAYDWDGTSANDHIGSWDLSYTRPGAVPLGDVYFTRSAGRRSVGLYVNITRVGDLHD